MKFIEILKNLLHLYEKQVEQFQLQLDEIQCIQQTHHHNYYDIEKNDEFKLEMKRILNLHFNDSIFCSYSKKFLYRIVCKR